MFPIPQCVFLTRGVGAHRHRLTALEYALRDADIKQQNLIAAQGARRGEWICAVAAAVFRFVKLDGSP
ncbi:pyruvoyl-dependent arginine decarboxylase [Methylocystis sp.]|uniref:pyruvoyl-dependent arginine decarboxylase n=1 Tax=Methylocystis sp. TaxID=1911079 RepID=UPI003D0F16C7